MTVWRMSFRVGNHGYEMWPDCLRAGVAAITYEPLTTTDLAQFPDGEPRNLWSQLAPAQKACLKQFAYKIKGGDTIYVKQGPKIVGKGTVRGDSNSRAYKFDATLQLRDPYGTPWAHQVPVEWLPDFPEVDILLGSEQFALRELSPESISELEGAAQSFAPFEANPPLATDKQFDPLGEENYYREAPASRKVIRRKHNILSNRFRAWLANTYQISAQQESAQVDIHYTVRGDTILAELKTCFGVGTRKAIREALGQILEYNYYPGRSPAQRWQIVLDETPSNKDRAYLDMLRATFSLPLALGWQSSAHGFEFWPTWP